MTGNADRLTLIAAAAARCEEGTSPLRRSCVDVDGSAGARTVQPPGRAVWYGLGGHALATVVCIVDRLAAQPVP